MIRPTTPEESNAIVALVEATGLFKVVEVHALREVLEDFHEVNHKHDHHAFTYEEAGGAIAGFVYYAPAPMTDRTWQLWWIAVRKDLQGKGIGTQLLHFVEQEIRVRHGRLIFIETGSPPQYEQTRQFYLKHGYERHAEFKDFYADGDSMIVFRKVV